MESRTTRLCLAVGITHIFLTVPTYGQTGSGPSYADVHTREIVERMVEAHGGSDNWFQTPSFQFTAGMYLASLPVNENRTYYDNWRYYRVTIEPRTSRGYVELPLEDESGPALAYDGDELWARPYNFDPSYRDAPLQLMFMHYGWISLPWLTQQPEVSLRSMGRDSLPGSDISYHAVEMTFSPRNKQHGGYYLLYIHPDTYRFSGFSQTVGFPYLPGDVIQQNLGVQESTGGVFRVIDAYTTVQGFVLPKSYYTVRVGGDEPQLLGAHLVIDPVFRESFDRGMLTRPDNARIMSRKPPSTTPQYSVTLVANTRPAIDGNLDDAAWKDVVWNDNFTSPTGGDPGEQTAFALAYDDTYLYVGLALNDRNPEQITQTPGERDDTEGDRIAVFFDTNADGVTTKVFVINAAGVIRDQTSSENGAAWDNGWNAEWTSAHQIDENGWSAEFRIPFSSLELENPAGDEWGFQLTRVVTRLGEQTFWSRPSPSRGFVGSFGRIRFVR